ncbi:MAG: D-aminoacyl-tRNA deacylase [Acidimicrobiia bacterium]|nr:D-aminoacyl-tRNA deacylase [Acidimicrobiia bacterium]
MRALVQRVGRASVTVVAEDGNRRSVGSIGRGLCVLVGVTQSDDEDLARKLASKIWHLRIFPDDCGAMNLPVADVGGEILVVSQFTLYGNTDRGRRPSFVAAARPEDAEPLIDALCRQLSFLGAHVATGEFRTHMQVELINDGPVTLMLEA